MTGWEKVAATTLLAVTGLAGLNLAIWRRMRAARAAHGAQREVEVRRDGAAQSTDHHR